MIWSKLNRSSSPTAHYAKDFGTPSENDFWYVLGTCTRARCLLLDQCNDRYSIRLCVTTAVEDGILVLGYLQYKQYLRVGVYADLRLQIPSMPFLEKNRLRSRGRM